MTYHAVIFLEFFTFDDFVLYNQTVHLLLAVQRFVLLFQHIPSLREVFARSDMVVEGFVQPNILFVHRFRRFIQIAVFEGVIRKSLVIEPLFKKSFVHRSKFQLWNAITGDWLKLIAKFSIPSCSKFYPLSKNSNLFFMILLVEGRYDACKPAPSNVWYIR